MSNTTLHPASQNFLVEISDECERPGTMWASVIWSGSHGMFKLHVCVDMIFLPFGNRIWIGLVAFLLLTTGAPSTRKWPVAPESETAYWMACTTLLVLNAKVLVVEVKLLAWMYCCHALCLVGSGMGLGRNGSLDSGGME